VDHIKCRNLEVEREMLRAATDKANMAAETSRLENEVGMAAQQTALSTISLLLWKYGPAATGFRALRSLQIARQARENQSVEEVELRFQVDSLLKDQRRMEAEVEAEKLRMRQHVQRAEERAVQRQQALATAAVEKAEKSAKAVVSARSARPGPGVSSTTRSLSASRKRRPDARLTSAVTKLAGVCDQWGRTMLLEMLDWWMVCANVQVASASETDLRHLSYKVAANSPLTALSASACTTSAAPSSRRVLQGWQSGSVVSSLIKDVVSNTTAHTRAEYEFKERENRMKADCADARRIMRDRMRECMQDRDQKVGHLEKDKDELLAALDKAEAVKFSFRLVKLGMIHVLRTLMMRTLRLWFSFANASLLRATVAEMAEDRRAYRELQGWHSAVEKEKMNAVIDMRQLQKSVLEMKDALKTTEGAAAKQGESRQQVDTELRLLRDEVKQMRKLEKTMLAKTRTDKDALVSVRTKADKGEREVAELKKSKDLVSSQLRSAHEVRKKLVDKEALTREDCSQRMAWGILGGRIETSTRLALTDAMHRLRSSAAALQLGVLRGDIASLKGQLSDMTKSESAAKHNARQLQRHAEDLEGALDNRVLKTVPVMTQTVHMARALDFIVFRTKAVVLLHLRKVMFTRIVQDERKKALSDAEHTIAKAKWEATKPQTGGNMAMSPLSADVSSLRKQLKARETAQHSDRAAIQALTADRDALAKQISLTTDRVRGLTSKKLKLASQSDTLLSVLTKHNAALGTAIRHVLTFIKTYQICAEHAVYEAWKRMKTVAGIRLAQPAVTASALPTKKLQSARNEKKSTTSKFSTKDAITQPVSTARSRSVTSRRQPLSAPRQRTKP
jgi:hypothetical protein